MILGHFLGVADPRVNEVGGILLHQFCFPAGSKILEWLRPHGDACLVQDAMKRRPGVGILLAISGDHVNLSRLRPNHPPRHSMRCGFTACLPLPWEPF